MAGMLGIYFDRTDTVNSRFVALKFPNLCRVH